MNYRRLLKEPPLSYLLYEPVRWIRRLRLSPYQIANRLYYSPRYTLPVWNHVVNRRARRLLRAEPLGLTDVQAQAVVDLRTKGIAVVPIESLTNTKISVLGEKAEAVIGSPTAKARIAEAVRLIESGGEGVRGRYWRLDLWEEETLNPEDEFVKLSLGDGILGVVCSYLGMMCRMKYLNFWYTLPLPDSHPKGERWHRDPEDKRMVKIFLYLHDIVADGGAFNYVLGSQDGGPYGNVFPRKPPYASNPSADEIESSFDEADRVVCAGSAGTLVFCDTSGLHRGGQSHGAPRLLFTTEYVTDATTHFGKPNWKLGGHDYSSLSALAQYAVGR